MTFHGECLRKLCRVCGSYLQHSKTVYFVRITELACWKYSVLTAQGTWNALIHLSSVNAVRPKQWLLQKSVKYTYIQLRCMSG